MGGLFGGKKKSPSPPPAPKPTPAPAPERRAGGAAFITGNPSPADLGNSGQRSTFLYG